MAVRRSRRRARPLAFRRRRRRAIPLLMIPAVVLTGLAAFYGAPSLLLWWEWTAGFMVVPIVLTGVALGIPGRRFMVLLRVLLFLPLVMVPLTGLLFAPREHPQWIGTTEDGQTTLLVIRTRLSGDVNDGGAVVHATAGPPLVSHRAGSDPAEPGEDFGRITVARDGVLFVHAERLVRLPPLWWLPPSGTVTGLTVTAGVSQGEGAASLGITTLPGPFTALQGSLERFLVAHRLLNREEESLRIPDSPGRFLQPGRYTVYGRPHAWGVDLPGEDLSYPPTLSYRYTQQ